MKCRRTSVLIIFILFFIPVFTFGYYPRKDVDRSVQTANQQVIVKLRAELNPHPTVNKRGEAVTGIEPFDNINSKYGILSQKFLFESSPESRSSGPLKNIVIVKAPDGVDMAVLVEAYEKLDEVVYAHPDWPLELYETPDDPHYSHQWGLNNIGQPHYHVERGPDCYDDILIYDSGMVDADIDALEVYENPPDKTVTAVVAVIDTGIDMDNPELAGRIWTNESEIPDNGLDDDHNGYIDDVHGWDFAGDLADSLSGTFPYDEDNDPTDEHGHGTHCAGIIAAVTDNAVGVAGINPDCLIMPLGFHPYFQTSFGARGIVYAADNGADIISMSWGLPWPAGAIEDAVEYAHSKGVALIAAAGNDGTEQYNYPAAYPNVITVGATDHNDEVTEFSTYGAHLEISAPGLAVLSLRADSTDMYEENCEPGVHIIDGYYYLASGTSMACPHVAGAAGYMRAVSPGLKAVNIQNILETSADDIIDPYGLGENLPGWDKYSGFGRLNLNNSLSALPDRRAKIISPVINQFVSGEVTITGIADGFDFTGYVLEYGEGSVPTEWTQIYASSSPVTNGTLGIWNTTGLNGQYTIRLRVDATHISMVTLYITNSTVASIVSPLENDTAISSAAFYGTALCPDFTHYTIEYGEGLEPVDFFEIVESSVPVIDDEICLWNIGTLPDGWYTFRLNVYSETGLAAADTVHIYMLSLFSTENAWKVSFDRDVTIMPNYGDFDNDGVNEIILGHDYGMVRYNVDGTLSDLKKLPPYLNYMVPPAVGEVDGDGIDDYVMVALWDQVPYITRIYVFPSTDTTYYNFLVSRPPYTSSYYGSDEFALPYVALKDIDSDGIDEIHYYPGQVSSSLAQYFVYRADGSLLLEIPAPCTTGYFGYVSADVDGDGIDEFYAGRNMLFQIDTLGVVQDSFDLSMGGAYEFRTYTMSADDIDGDGKLELIVFGAYWIPGGTHWTYVFDENLVLKSGWPHDSGINYYLAMCGPVFGDIDGDGGKEYFLSMSELNYGRVLAWHVDGSPYTGDSAFPVFGIPENPAKLTTPVIADMNNDFLPDVVVCAGADIYQTYVKERIIAWDNNTDILPGYPLVTVPEYDTVNPGSDWHAPVIGDINNDGNVDMIMTTINNELMFINFDNIPYNSNASPAVMWRYNRRLNATGTIRAFICGDVNSDGYVNIFDITFIIDYLYRDGATPAFPESADINNDGTINIFDITGLINYLYYDGPFPNCP